VSSFGSYISGVGVLIFFVGMVARFHPQGRAANNPWDRRNHARVDPVLAAAVP